MKSARAVAFVLMAASLILAACGNAAPAVPSPSPTAPPPTRPSPPSPTPTRLLALPSTPASTATPKPCDPSAADYCIEDAYFVFQPPILPPGTDSIDRSYPYGSTEGGQRAPHHGVEFYNASGTPVHSAADGTVFYAGDDTSRRFSPWSGFYGNIVILEHSLSGAPFDKLYTLYAHLSQIAVSRGQAVTAGELIGVVGSTGTASGSHLHFEVRVDPDDYASTLNPEMWLLPHPGNGTLALSAVDGTGISLFPAFNVQYYPDPDHPATASFPLNVYAPETRNARNPWSESAALGDQPAGLYRVTFLQAGVLYERWVEIQPGKLTRVMFVVK